ncbi:protocadherin fat 4 [Plakobranchus ocellatus]|uniref:Protocadherin fat 4 n=1 Tax=Plakobranchus ocellatus TaxID=259542 RepID=A0AAV4CZP7_9GAST|nr:protocadherin fat 4 [Plakobranchus ocellatus]
MPRQSRDQGTESVLNSECLQYRAGVGRLDHDSTSRYLVTVSCEDTARDTATEVIQIVIIPNQPPKFDPDTLETTFEISATLGPGDEVGQVPATDEDGDLLSYSLSVIPSSAHGAFSIQSDGMIVAHVDLRTLCRSFVTLEVTVTDGHNTVGPKVTDVNEVPVISDHRTSIEICEGRTEFLPPFTMTDEDEDETHIWTYFGGNNDDGFFFVHPETGVLGTNIDYDVDPDYDKPRRYSRTFEYRIQVTDKGGLSATATVTATFLDCNDNAPRFTRAFFTYTANECTAPGSVLGRLTGQDADSDREGNNQLTFSGASGAIDIGDTGNVIVTKPLAAGSVVVFDAYVTDQGQTPGALRSEQPAKVSVIFGVCPEPTVSDSTTAASADSNERRRGNNLPWIIIAAILGTLLLGLLSFMLWRYWSMIGEACGNIDCSKACRGRPQRRA